MTKNETPTPRRTRQEMAQAEVDRWAGKVEHFTGQIAKLKAGLTKAEVGLSAANAEYEHAKTAPALRAIADPAQTSIDDVLDEEPPEGGEPA